MVGAVQNMINPPEKAFAAKPEKSYQHHRQAGRKSFGRRNKSNYDRGIGRCGTSDGVKPVRAQATQAAPAFKTADILQAMQDDLYSSQAQQHCCRALQWLAVQCGDRDKRACQDDVVASGGLDAVLKAMENHVESPEVQLEAIGALEKISTSNEQNTAYLCSHGGLEAVVQAMSRHVEQQHLQERGCRVLMNAIACSADIQAKAVSAGGIQAVLQAMKTHLHAAALQEVSCRALKELAAYNAGNQDDIYTHGGIQTVLRTMELHSSLASIQVAGCGVLRNMTACSATHQEAVAERGGVQVVLEGMRSHEDTASVQWAGCWALFCFAVHNTEMQTEVAAHGAVRIALTALTKHQTEPKTQEAVLWLIKELAGQLAKDNGLFMSAVTAVLREMGATSPLVKKAAASALRQLAAHDTGGRVKTTCLGRCGRLGRSTTMKALEAIKE
jgi:hypothetical protein